jgi:hypothetical protein
MTADIRTGPPSKLLTAILPLAGARVAAARDALHAAGIDTVTQSTARGAPVGAELDRHGIPIWEEVEILCALVPADRADEIFWRVHEAGAVGTPGGGMILLNAVGSASAFEVSPSFRQAAAPAAQA